MSRRIGFSNRGRAEQYYARSGGATVLTLFPVQQRRIDRILSLRLLKGHKALAGVLSHRPGWLPRDF